MNASKAPKSSNRFWIGVPVRHHRQGAWIRDAAWKTFEFRFRMVCAAAGFRTERHFPDRLARLLPPSHNGTRVRYRNTPRHTFVKNNSSPFHLKEGPSGLIFRPQCVIGGQDDIKILPSFDGLLAAIPVVSVDANAAGLDVSVLDSSTVR